METLTSDLFLNQMQIRGRYERGVTDTAQLAGELIIAQDINRLVTDFDNGVTPLRDVGGMIESQRSAILSAFDDGSIESVMASHPFVLTKPVANLHKRVAEGPKDQPVGHNFFVNATGFIEVGYPWARRFEELLVERTGFSAQDIAADKDIAGKDRLLAELTENPDIEATAAIAVYLAGRSLAGEEYLYEHFGQQLREAKSQTYNALLELAVSTGLSENMFNRGIQQLRRTRFGSFDHLVGLVTSGDSGKAGDYMVGSLLIEVQFENTVGSPSLPTERDAKHVIAHELQHASSAQDGSRCGLLSKNQGLEANEGLTEYIARLSLGNPGIERQADGSIYVHEMPYRVAVVAFLTLHEQFEAGKNNYFAVLFNAYHGDVTDQSQLEEALDEFYRLDELVSQLIG